jgi:hypothetical protein
MRAAALCILIVPLAATAWLRARETHWQIAGHLSAHQSSALMLDALLVYTAMAIVVAPVAAVWAICRYLRMRRDDMSANAAERGSVLTIVLTIIAGASLFAGACTASARLIIGAPFAGGLLSAAAMLWACGIALAFLGAWSSSVFADPLDAAAFGLAAAVGAAGGALIFGPVLAAAPTGVINAALMVSPVVAVASAASIDLLRTDALYQLSPLAHVRFDYPPWLTTFGCYVAVASVFLGGLLVNLNRLDRRV